MAASVLVFLAGILLRVTFCQTTCSAATCHYAGVADSRLTIDMITAEPSLVAPSGVPSQLMTIASDGSAQFQLCSNSSSEVQNGRIQYKQQIAYALSNWSVGSGRALELRMIFSVYSTSPAM